MTQATRSPVDHPTTVVGDYHGLGFPTTIEPLLERGPEFLTAAFRRSGIMQPDNGVVAISKAEEFFGGGMGRKACLTVDYAYAEPRLKRELFVKFPRPFGDPLRDLFAPLMESEIRFALLSRQDDFPISVPTCYFADYHHETLTGMLITERIAYGEHGIEPCHAKCLDYEMAETLEHYRALTRAMARLAAHHKTGRFGPLLDRQFPFDPNHIDTGSRIPYSFEQLAEKLRCASGFVDRYPRLVPAPLRDEQSMRSFCEEAMLVLKHERAIRSYLNANPAYIALCHWNVNVDNAWFWADGPELRAGLLDWGGVGQMNMAQAFYGMTCAAETEFLNAHREDLIGLFMREYSERGGSGIERSALEFMIKLSIAVLGIAWILDAPTLIQTSVPDLSPSMDRQAPQLKDNFLARAQLQLFVVMLNEWLNFGVGPALRAFSRGERA